MALCHKPNYGYQHPGGSLTWASSTRPRPESERAISLPVEHRDLPCGKCPACRAHHREAWSLRCAKHLESITPAYEVPPACFITLTYDAANLPDRGWIDRSDARAFINDLRDVYPAPHFSYFGCEEYGGTGTFRPHVHLLLFGQRFEDYRSRPRIAGNGLPPAYDQAEIRELWGRGRVEVQDVPNPSTAARYIAGYLQKPAGYDLFTTQNAYWADNPDYDPEADPEADGLLFPPSPKVLVTAPEPRAITTTGRDEHVAVEYCHRNISRIYPDDFVEFNGRRVRPPAAWDRICERDYPELWEQVLDGRAAYRDEHDIPSASDSELEARRTLWAVNKARIDGSKGRRNQEL